MSALSETQLEQFNEQGYIILKSFLNEALIGSLKVEVDSLVDEREKGTWAPVGSRQEIGMLTSHPPLMEAIESIMGPGFALHHVHAARRDAGNAGVNWHQDYEQTPQANRSHLMVHVFFYLNGLDGQIGDLLVLPGSQNMVAANNAFQMFGHEDLPGSVVVDDVPPGTAIIVHSAVFHARRPKPGGEGKPRYFIDSSYCQAGITWPNVETCLTTHDMAVERGFDRDGRYAHVYNRDMFFDRQKAQSKLEALNSGSVVNALKEADS